MIGFDDHSPAETQRRMTYAVEAMEALQNGEEPPEPPEGIKRERLEEKADRRARARVHRLIESGEYEHVNIDERCMGLGVACALCNQKLPSPGDPPQRCPKRS